ncbi:glycosyltransferase family 4 protein [Candidatus Bathyarchaeota archaeon]|nr:glycosyltransferase family 4 protein [Candidatus Bathyarchaeota archaeon]
MPSVCFIATEFFAWGMHGGIGKATRDIAAGLADRGWEVRAVVPRGEGQGEVESLDGVTVYSHPLHMYPLTRLYREIDADIIHSQEPSWGTLLAMKQNEGRVHVATSQNPRTRSDWRSVERYYLPRRRLYNRLVQPGVEACVKHMDAVYCQAKYIVPKTRRLYRLDSDPVFLPNPVDVPQGMPRKNEDPTVCFLGRLDAEKGPETFFGLAERFPEVRFIAAGSAHDAGRDRRLREMFGGVPNLEMRGFLDGTEKEAVLDESWVLVNTSVRECLPVSFLEAAAHGCAVLSSHDPDGFASGFGYHAEGGDYEEGLRRLLGDDRWRAQGEKGRRYVSEVHERSRVLDLHVMHYEALLRR